MGFGIKMDFLVKTTPKLHASLVEKIGCPIVAQGAILQIEHGIDPQAKVGYVNFKPIGGGAVEIF